MGIVVTIFMLLGLLLVSPNSAWGPILVRNLHVTFAVVRAGVLITGVWNTGWYGLRHLGEFWGHAALVSGLLMIAAASLTRKEPDGGVRGALGAGGLVGRAYVGGPILIWLLRAGLLAFFLLYAITLIRLNLGYSIIES